MINFNMKIKIVKRQQITEQHSRTQFKYRTIVMDTTTS